MPCNKNHPNGFWRFDNVPPKKTAHGGHFCRPKLQPQIFVEYAGDSQGIGTMSFPLEMPQQERANEASKNCCDSLWPTI